MQDDAEWSDWDAAPDDGSFDAITVSRDESAEAIPDLAGLGASENTLPDAAFADLLRSLRAVPGPCAPPVGEGAFDILFANAHEIVVWYAPAKDGIQQREVSIPARLARIGWGVLRRGEPVDAGTLAAIGTGPSGGAWLFALFAQLPDVEVRAVPSDADGDAASPLVTLRWRGSASQSA